MISSAVPPVSRRDARKRRVPASLSSAEAIAVSIVAFLSSSNPWLHRVSRQTPSSGVPLGVKRVSPHRQARNGARPISRVMSEGSAFGWIRSSRILSGSGRTTRFTLLLAPLVPTVLAPPTLGFSRSRVVRRRAVVCPSAIRILSPYVALGVYRHLICAARVDGALYLVMIPRPLGPVNRKRPGWQPITRLIAIGHLLNPLHSLSGPPRSARRRTNRRSLPGSSPRAHLPSAAPRR